MARTPVTGRPGQRKQDTRAFPFLGELGVTGLSRWGGYVREEFLRELQGKRGIRVYREMRDNDAMVGAVLFAIEQLIRGVTWSIELPTDLETLRAAQEAAARATQPPAPRPVPEPPEPEPAPAPAPSPAPTPDPRLPLAGEIREFIHGALFEDMSTGWSDVVSEILSMLWYGWAYLELVYKLRQGPQPEDSPVATSRFADARWGWRKWSIRAQETLHEWTLDASGGIQGLRQDVPYGQGTAGGGTVFIPIAKALLFRTRSDRNNPEGRSLLRNAYRAWYFKRRIEEVEGIGIERDLAGLPVLKPAEGVPLWDTEDPDMVTLKAACERLIRNLKRDEQEGVLLPHDWELTLLTTGSRRQFDTTAIIERYDTRIALTVLADFVLLGHEAVGSWALSSDKTELFAKAVGGFLDMIASTVNRHAIPRLVRMNGWPEDLSPHLVHGDLETPDLEGLTNLVIQLGSVTDPVLQRHLRQLAGLPLGDTSDPMVGKRRGETWPVSLTKRERAMLTALEGVQQAVADINARQATRLKLRARQAKAEAQRPIALTATVHAKMRQPVVTVPVTIQPAAPAAPVVIPPAAVTVQLPGPVPIDVEKSVEYDPVHPARILTVRERRTPRPPAG